MPVIASMAVTLLIIYNKYEVIYIVIYIILVSDMQFYSFLVSPSSTPGPICILSICFDNSSLLLKVDSQYGHLTLLSLLILDI